MLFHGDLNQLLSEYGITDDLERRLLTRIAQTSHPDQALQYARFVLRHTPHLQEALVALLEQTQPSILLALQTPEPEAKPKPLRRSPEPRVFPRQGTAIYDAALQPQSFTLPPEAVVLQSSTFNPQPFVTHPAPGSAAYDTCLSEPLVTPSVTVPLHPIKLDPELGRLAIALNQASELRLWLLGREVADQGRGWLTLDELRKQVKLHRIDIGARHLRRLIAQEQGVFWWIDPRTKRLYLRSIFKIARLLTRAALLVNPDLVATNLPGMLHQVYVPLEGSLADFEARIYAAWFTVKNAPVIARATLMMLFGRDQRTMRRWEKSMQPQDESNVPYGRRKHRPALEVIPSYAQSADPEAIHQRPGKHHLVPVRHYEVWVAHLENGQWRRLRERRVSYPLPNCYRSQNMQEHPHTGQARHVLRAAAYAAGFEPPQVETIVKTRGIRPNPRRFFNRDRQLRTHVKRFGEVPYTRYLWRGESQRGKRRVHLYEPNETGHPATSANERPVVGDLLERHRRRTERRKYLDWFKEEKRWEKLMAIGSDPGADINAGY